MAASVKQASDVVKYLDTATAYDLWAEVYDTDNNFLQALDSVEFQNLLPKLLSGIKSPKPWKIIDLGCGTGRNTVHLLDIADTDVVALDLSPKMLQIARERLSEASGGGDRLTLQVFDVMNPTTSTTNPPPRDADAMISTLVVEHVPLGVYFSAAAAMLKLGGLFLLTNMHSDMGRISQAGFIDPKTGHKIRPRSYAHTVQDIVAEAARHGLEVFSKFEERGVTTETHELFGPRAGKWVGINVWYGGILKRI
ncbi:cyclopropane-fatty-acyl-phospholipid synthase [Podospora didyma]|uniref:Cyclopropane-fatty-acyl-phospholipid synthase n=1 Tax=Podospora didyma TaxID=330526 RepID=A0AAE0K6W9_9PEZI|nr:cyclopropane-fatty-acyl-phospholipid synthase [Podospora didyma]